MFVLMDFYIRVMNEIQQLNYPIDLLLIYSLELFIVIRFTYANIKKTRILDR